MAYINRMSIGCSAKPLGTIDKLPDNISKLMIGKIWPPMEITTAMIGKDVLAICW